METETSTLTPTDFVVGNELELQVHHETQERGERTEVAFGRSHLYRGLTLYRERRGAQGIVYPQKSMSEYHFNSTGAMDYLDNELPEEATAECSLIAELVPRAQAHENFGIELGKALARETDRTVYIHMRTAGSNSRVTSGCHDSIGIETRPDEDVKKDLDKGLLGYLAISGIFSGAGLITRDGMYFGQKLRWLTTDSGGGLNNSGYAVKSDKGGMLAEVRCRDFNLLPTATRMRLGLGRIAVLLATSPLKSRIHGFTNAHARHLREGVTQFNKIPVDQTGQFFHSFNMTLAVSEQMRQLELFLDNLHHFEESAQLEELCGVAEDGLIVGDRLFRVMAGGDLDLIADDFDWAAKLRLAKRQMELDREKGIKRTLFDQRGQLLSDLGYDAIKITWRGESESGEDEYRIIRGSGYINRERRLGMLTTAEAAEIALVPPNTRAAVRAELLEEYEVASCYWDVVRINRQPDGDPIRIELPDATSPQLPLSQQRKLCNQGRRRVPVT